MQDLFEGYLWSILMGEPWSYCLFMKLCSQIGFYLSLRLFWITIKWPQINTFGMISVIIWDYWCMEIMFDCWVISYLRLIMKALHWIKLMCCEFGVAMFFLVMLFLLKFNLNCKCFSTHSQVLAYTWDGFDKHWQENRAQQGSGSHPNIWIDQLDFPRKGGILSSSMCSRLVVTPSWVMHMLQYTFPSPYLYMGWLWQALAGK